MGIALVLGIFAGYPLLAVLITAISLLIWQAYRLEQLYKWVRDPTNETSPETSGLLYLLHREINRRRTKSTIRKRQLTGYLSQFRKAASALPDALLLIDDAGKIEWANVNAFQLLGIEWPRDRGVRVIDLLREPEISDLLADASPPTHGIEVSLANRREQTLNIQCLRYTEVLRMVIARDVSRLVKVNKIHTDFIANVSHELKTPLTVLRGYLEIMAGRNDLPASLDKPLNQMKFQSDRMELLVADLIYLAKLEDQVDRHHYLAVNVSHIVSTIMQSIQALIETKQHKIKIELDPDVHIRGNQAELHSAFQNLISNAVNYTSQGGVIKIEWVKYKTGAAFSVNDNGVGIPANAIPNLTKRFFRVDEDRSRDSGGTGLGLAIVKHVLQRHDAKLEINSQLARGSEFRCVFPEQNLITTAADQEQHRQQSDAG